MGGEATRRSRGGFRRGLHDLQVLTESSEGEGEARSRRLAAGSGGDLRSGEAKNVRRVAARDGD